MSIRAALVRALKSRLAKGALQLVFVLLAWKVLLALLEWATEPRYTREAQPSQQPASDAAWICLWLLALWAMGRQWSALRRPVSVVASTAILVAPWLQQRAAWWLSECIVRSPGSWFGGCGGHAPSVYFLYLLPESVLSTWLELADRLNAVMWRRSFGLRADDRLALSLMAAAFSVVVAVLVGRSRWRRWFAIATVMLAALWGVSRATLDLVTKPQIEDWMRGMREVDRVAIARIRTGPEWDTEARAYTGTRLSDGRVVWRRRPHSRDTAQQDWVIEIANDRTTESRHEPRATSRLHCDDGAELVVREREFPRWRFARCEVAGRSTTARAVEVRSEWQHLIRAHVVSTTAMPREWVQMAWAGLGFGVIALGLERAIRLRKSRKLRARTKREERAGEHPYRASQSVEPTRAKRVESEEERASAEAMDQWVIVAIALQWAMPVATWMLAARYVPGW